MYLQPLRKRLSWRQRKHDQRGAVAILVALALTSLLVVAAMVLDFGLVRVDRQVNKSVADAAVLAGLHGLDTGGSDPLPFVGVCTAINYLRLNDSRFDSVTSTSPLGHWTDGNGTATGDGCTDSTLKTKTCNPGDKSSWAKFEWLGTADGEPLRVTIQSGYDLAGSAWSEEALPALQSDQIDEDQGCDQLAVIITQNRKPGLGSLATSSDLVSSVRSVGRVKLGPGNDAPAMLLLKRTGCPVLQTGSSSGGSYIHVYGDVDPTTNKSTPGTIHADADGKNCTGGSNQSIFLGKANDGIVAYAAPLATDTTAPDPTKPGVISTYAGANGTSLSSSIIRDGAPSNYVYGSSAINEAGAASAAKNLPTSRDLVTRKVVDDRYLAGVHAAIDGAQATVFGPLAGATTASGYTVAHSCSSLTAAQTAAASLFVDCTDPHGFVGTSAGLTINATTVVFNGWVNPAGVLSLPNATHVYIFGSSSHGVALNSLGATLSVHTAGNVSGGYCKTAATVSADKAVLFIKNGDIAEANGGLLQLCNTTAFMMGGQPDGCLPPLGYPTTPPPYDKPCARSSGTPVYGTGQLSQTGGDVDWTAPNQYDIMTLSDGDPDPTKAAAWSDKDGPEDLAFWSESAGNNSMPTYNMNGGGLLRVQGVYMVPNADPFIIGGNSSQTLANAQYIASSIALNGTNTKITMRVDANSVVTLPQREFVGLVR